MKIPFSKVDCSGSELAYVKEVLESGWLTTASKAQALESKFSEMVGVDYACAVNSCTSALHLALEALGVGQGDKVLLPSMTFTATAEVVRYLGADPVFLDVEYGSSQLSVEIVEKGLKLHPDAKVVIVVDFGGQPAPLLRELCHQYGVMLIADAAHAFPARMGGRMVGTLADITCFSFYANKTITTGEGGMLTTNDEALYKRVKMMRLHGIDRDVWDRFTSDKPSWEYDVKAPGFKYNMPDINAAIGLAQLERAEDMRSVRQQIAELYLEELADVEEVDLPVIHVPYKDHAWHLFPIVLNEKATIDRNQLIEQLAAVGIGASVHYKPLHRMSYYKNQYSLKPEDFPNTEKIWQGNLSLPIYSLMSREQAYEVTAGVRHSLLVLSGQACKFSKL
jgi:dTDP-4-amino-4,6-dideoxygalactose transaminase